MKVGLGCDNYSCSYHEFTSWPPFALPDGSNTALPRKGKTGGKGRLRNVLSDRFPSTKHHHHLCGKVPKGGRFWILSVPVQKWYAEAQNLKQKKGICYPQSEVGVEALHWSPQPLFLGYWRNHRRQMENNCSNFGHLYCWNVLKFIRLELGFDEMGLGVGESKKRCQA